MAAQTVIGFFDDQQEALRAVEQLQSRGISRDRVDVSSGNSGTAGTTDVSSERSDSDRSSGIGGFFKNLFSDDDDQAERYSRVASNSNSIVTVHAQSEEEAETAADILDDCGAVDVDERAAQHGFTNTRSSQGMEERQNISGDRDEKIERIEENLEVGKRTVEQGGVRVRSRIVERPVEEHIRLREEHVHVERQAVNRPVSGDALSNFQERDIELNESREVPVVNKQARVVEEINLSKEVTERNETINDTVRNTEVDIDRDDTNNQQRGDMGSNQRRDDLDTNRGI